MTLTREQEGVMEWSFETSAQFRAYRAQFLYCRRWLRALRDAQLTLTASWLAVGFSGHAWGWLWWLNLAVSVGVVVARVWLSSHVERLREKITAELAQETAKLLAFLGEGQPWGQA